MPITLQDAIERAELMVGESGDLRQESYSLLSRQLDDEDVYPFTIALVERGINVRTGSRSRKAQAALQDLFDADRVSLVDAEPSFEDFLAEKVAQTFTQKEPGGLWVPEQYAPDPEVPVYVETDTGEDEEVLEEISDEDIEWEGTLDEYDELVDVENYQRELEDLGVSFTPEGDVAFYQSNIPGLYTERNPLKPMPLEKAFKYYDQQLRMVDREQTKVNGVLDLLSRLGTDVRDMESTLDALSDSGYSGLSRNKSISDIANAIISVQGDIESGQWDQALVTLDDLKGRLGTYSESQREKYDGALQAVETLDKLLDLQKFEPLKFQKIVHGLGGVVQRAASYRGPEYQRLDVNIGEYLLKDAFTKEYLAAKGTNEGVDEHYKAFFAECVDDGELSDNFDFYDAVFKILDLQLGEYEDFSEIDVSFFISKQPYFWVDYEQGGGVGPDAVTYYGWPYYQEELKAFIAEYFEYAAKVFIEEEL